MTKPVTGLTQWGAATSGSTGALDANFTDVTTAINDFNTYGNYLLDTGSANSYLVTLPANITGVLTDGLPIQVKIANSNTGASTLAYNGSPAIGITNIDGSALAAGALPANGIVYLQYSAGAGTWILQTSAIAVGTIRPQVRQAIQSGPNASGISTLLPAANGNTPASANLTLTTSNISVSVPLIVSGANGFGSTGALDLMGLTTANLTWANLTANTNNYLGVVIAANGSMTTAFTTNVPVEQFGGNASTGAGNYTFNIQAMQMQAGNGNAAAQTYTVFVGEANCNANAVVSTVSYQALARFDSGLVSTLPGTSNNAVQNHNIGTKNLEGYLYVENINSEIGYSVGDRVAFTIGSSGSSGVPNATWWNRLAVGWSTDNGNALRVVPRGGGSDQAVTQANWKYGFFMHRNY
jgi:hypothetical protein